MHRIDGYGATPDNKFTEGDPAQSVPATDVTDDWLNAVQGEIVSVIEEAGIVLNKDDNTQLLTAILAIAAGASGGVKVVTAVESPYLVQTSDSVLLMDCSSGEVSVVFPSAASGSSRRLTTKKIDQTNNAAKLSPLPDQTIEGESESYDSTMPGEFMSFVPDGTTAWHRVG